MRKPHPDLPFVAGSERAAGKLDRATVADAAAAGFGAAEVGLRRELRGIETHRQRNNHPRSLDRIAPPGLDEFPEDLVAARIDPQCADHSVLDAEAPRPIDRRLEKPGERALTAVIFNPERARIFA